VSETSSTATKSPKFLLALSTMMLIRWLPFA
jgi:hypothetical protein